VLLEQLSDGSAIHTAIALGAWRPHSRSLAPIEHSKLKGREISRAPHDTAERIDLAHYRSLCHATNRGVAGHLAYTLERTRDQPNACTKTSCCYRGFRSGMASADDNDVELFFNGS